MNPYDFGQGKRYHTLAFDNRKQGFCRHKAALDVGLTCPNLDGRAGTGGCVFCGGGGGYFTRAPALSVSRQLDLEIARIRAKRPDAQIVAYFQAHTNTYAPVKRLEALWEEALAHEGVSGLAVATRADCLPPPVVELLARLARQTYVSVELGLQTVHDETAQRMGRGHDFAAFLAGYRALKERGVRVCVHLIDGLPGESTDQSVESARVLGRLHPDGVKLHLLHVIQGTALAEIYDAGKYRPLTLPEYVDAVVRQLEVLPPETVIERITGDGDRRTLLAPVWSLDKLKVLRSIDQAMALQDTWQGRLFSP